MAKLALLIGVSEYQPGLNPIPAAVRDIEAMQRVLLDSGMGDFSEAKLLTNPDKTKIETETESLFSHCTKDDLVLLFFSGHGIKDDRGRLYFAATNTRKNPKGELIRSSAVSARFVHDIMENSRCKRQAVILDCCFSGAFDPVLMAKDDGSVDLQAQLGSPGRVVLTSSSSTQYSFQQEDAELSIYTRFLVEGIETGVGDADEDGFVSADELHKYAASKVQEIAPNMTPRIIVIKEEGYNLILAKARISDPKLVYRKEAARFAAEGKIRPVGRSILNEKQHQLGLTDAEAVEIEKELLRPFQERLENIEKYRAALTSECEQDYPLSEQVKAELENLQNVLGLRDEDVLLIRNEVEENFSEQREAYQKHIEQFKEALVDAINHQFPFSQEKSQALLKLQKSLGLRVADINRIRQPLIQQAALKYEQKLNQEAQERHEKELQDEFESKLWRYQEEFSKAVDLAYPLDDDVQNDLKQLQQSLGLADAEVAQLEQPILGRAEAEREKQLRQHEELQQNTEAQQQEQLSEKTTLVIDPQYHPTPLANIREKLFTRTRGGGKKITLGLLVLGILGFISWLIKFHILSSSPDIPFLNTGHNSGKLPKFYVMRLVGKNNQPIDISVVKDPKKLLGKGESADNPASKDSSSETVLENKITITSGSLVAIDRTFPPLPSDKKLDITQSDSSIQALLIWNCRSIVSEGTETSEQTGVGNLAPDIFLNKETVKEKAEPLDDPKVDSSNPAVYKFQIGWVELSQLEPFVEKTFHHSDLSEDQRKACASPTLKKEGIPAGAPINSD